MPRLFFGAFLLLLAVLTSLVVMSFYYNVQLTPVWKAAFRANFVSFSCREDYLFRSCSNVSFEECQTLFEGDAFEKCDAELGNALPFLISLPEQGQEWGSKYGSCMGVYFEEVYKERFVSNETCDRVKRSLGIPTADPRSRGLQALFSTNPGFELIYEHDEKTRALFHKVAESLPDGIEGENWEPMIKAYAEIEVLTQPYVAGASNEIIIEYYQNEVARREAYLSFSPELCESVFFGNSVSSAEEVSRIKEATNDAEFIKNSRLITHRAIEEVIKNGPVVDAPETAEQLVSEALAGKNITEGCEGSIELMGAFLSLPQDKAGIALRALHVARQGHPWSDDKGTDE